uniref:Glycoprotease 1 n=1 Tax=Tetradesmus obliquus TaxID=3088 RepID=A0A383WI28_TETOB|eukprot:jgi/Sobl393_1/8019/SZX77081.1
MAAATAEAAADSSTPLVSVLSYRWSDKNVFHAINEGRFPAEKIFDRPHFYALLDKMPVTRGHALLITKHPVATLLESKMPPEAMAGAMGDLQALSRAVQQATGCAGVRVRQNNGPAAGQVVPQLHFHVIPTESPEDEDPSKRSPLQDEDAGRLLAGIRNALPVEYSGAGVHAWIPTAAAMEALGCLLHSLCIPGTVLLLSPVDPSPFTAIARGIVRAFCGDPAMFVPSPTFLLNLTYQEDTAHEKDEPTQEQQQQPDQQQQQPDQQQQQQPDQQQPDQQQQQLQQQPDRQQQQQRQQGRCIHHMDPYRLGTTDKMAGLIDFESAFQNDVCVIEWPSRMPDSVMQLPRRRTIEVNIGGSGAQAAGRLVHISCSQEEPDLQQQQQQVQANGAPSSSSSSSSSGPCAQLLAQWRQSGLPEPQVKWKAAAEDTSDDESDGDAEDAAAVAARLQRRLQRKQQQQQQQQQLGGAAGQAPAGPPEGWLVLGIESSCDDTAAAVVRGDGKVLSHCIASQGRRQGAFALHRVTARDAHAAAIHSTVDDAIREAGIQPQQLSAVAVTIGPGLSLCLQVGVRHALQLSAQHQLPWVPVHHMEAHALMAAMPGVLQQQQQQQGEAAAAAAAATAAAQPGMSFPALLLLASGGHNMLVRCEGVGRHTVLGTTIDDSMGEAFDKVARLLGISAIPGGPHLERLAAKAVPEDLKRYKGQLMLPLRRDTTSCNFSFSGLKTSVGKIIEAEKSRLQQEGADEEATARVYAAIACLFQDVCVRFLEERTDRALARCRQDEAEAGQPMVTCLVVAGGVAANAKVRATLQAVAAKYGLACLVPPVQFCSDNGLMVAWTGVERLKLGLCRAPPPNMAAAEAAVEVLPRWPLGPVDVRGMSKQNAKHCKLLH